MIDWRPVQGVHYLLFYDSWIGSSPSATLNYISTRKQMKGWIVRVAGAKSKSKWNLFDNFTAAL